MAEPRVRVLFVCTANICRSPTAQGAFEALLREEGLDGVIEVDSAGTHDYWGGAPPDPRAVEAAQRRGLDLTSQRARTVGDADFDRFDVVLAMERAHVRFLRARCRPEQRDRIRCFMELIPDAPWADMPDPYAGGSQGFEIVLDLVERGCRALLEELRPRLP